MINKNFIFLFLGLFLISLTSASPGIYKQGQDINLIQTCADCTTMTLTSVVGPDGVILVSNKTMEASGSTYNYTLDKGNTTQLGTYRVNGIGNPAGVSQVWSYSFSVTYTGDTLKETSPTLYIILFAVFGFLFFMNIFLIGKLPDGNTKDEEGTLVRISYLKYLRPILWFVSWLFIVAILYLSSNIAFAYLEDAMFATLLFNLFRIAMGMTLPIVVVWIIWTIGRIIDDKELKKCWNRGIFPHKI